MNISVTGINIYFTWVSTVQYIYLANKNKFKEARKSFRKVIAITNVWPAILLVLHLWASWIRAHISLWGSNPTAREEAMLEGFRHNRCCLYFCCSLERTGLWSETFCFFFPAYKPNLEEIISLLNIWHWTVFRLCVVRISDIFHISC